MNFGAPAFLGLAALALPLIVLYILKVRRRAVTVPYLRLWQELVVETRARSLFERLKRLLSLLLQLLILAALVFALARPSFEAHAADREHVVLVLDASASMQALEDGKKARFELALERAREMVEKRRGQDEMMIVAASDRVEVLCPFTKSRLLLRDGLDTARVTSSSLDAGGAIEFAREVARDHEHARIRFVSDGDAGRVRAAIDRAGLGTKKEPDSSIGLRTDSTHVAVTDGDGSPAQLARDAAACDPAARDERAELVLVGAAKDNVGILRFAARKSTSLGTDFVLAVVKNFGPEPVELNLELALNERSQKVVPMRFAAGEEITQRFDLALPEGGTLRLSIDRPDALLVDNTAFAIVRPSRLQRVVVVAPDARSLEPFRMAFESMTDVVDDTSIAVTAEEYRASTDEMRRANVTIGSNVLPDPFPKEGDLVLLNTELPASLPAEITGVEEQPSVWDWDHDHILNRYLNWRDLPLPKARIVHTREGHAIVSGYEGPLVTAFDLNGRRAIYGAFDVTARLFPFRLAFPIFMRNAIAWFDVDEERVISDSYPTGASITPLVRLPGEKVTAAFFEKGLQQTQELALVSGRFHFDRTAEPGPIVFTPGAASSGAAGTDRQFACAVNLFDAYESAIAPDEPPASDAAASEGRTRGGGWPGWDTWVYGALAALILWALEWAFYHRRITE